MNLPHVHIITALNPKTSILIHLMIYSFRWVLCDSQMESKIKQEEWADGIKRQVNKLVCRNIQATYLEFNRNSVEIISS